MRARAHAAWNEILDRIRITGGTSGQRTVFYSALYHTLLGENLYSDVNGEYFGMDQKVHKVAAPQQAQYATFSGWDVYRSQLQLVTLIDPAIASDIAQSLLNQADQNGGEWDRWTHNSGETHVMNGDPAAPAIADILAFGGNRFNARAAYESLLKAATVPTAHDLSRAGCPVECVGQRPSLDLWLKLHYIPTDGNAWGGAADTLEDVTADFSLSELARRMHDQTNQKILLVRAQYWKNLFNPNATTDAGYIQNRNADGSWPKFDPASTHGFVEGSAAQYVWMVPFNVQGLFDMMGGRVKANARLDSFFHKPDGSWAVTESGGLHAELNNEPSIETPWLYDFSGQTWKTQETVRQVLNTIWTNTPNGMPGQRRPGRDVLVVRVVGHGVIPGDSRPRGAGPRQPAVSQGAHPPGQRPHHNQGRGRSGRCALRAQSARERCSDDQDLAERGFPAPRWNAGLHALVYAEQEMGTGAKDAPPSFAPAE